MNLLLLGFGYSASAVVRLGAGRFTRIDGTVRSSEKANALGSEGAIHVYQGGAPSVALQSAIATADIAIATAAPSEAGDPFLADLGAYLGTSPRLKLIQYLSTVGVYGDAGGGWIDETTPVNPPNRRGVLRVEAELAWRKFGAERRKAVQIHRLAGIYGPGRNALLDVAQGTARRIDKPGQVFNRIHVDDIAGALLVGMTHGDDVFNIGDDEPAPASDVVAFAAELLGVPPPPPIPFEAAELSEMGRSFYSTNKRCSNARVKAELGFRFAFPNYREALRALYATGEGRGGGSEKEVRPLARRPIRNG